MVLKMWCFFAFCFFFFDVEGFFEQRVWLGTGRGHGGLSEVKRRVDLCSHRPTALRAINSPPQEMPPLPVVSERFFVTRDGLLGMQLLTTPSPLEQEYEADKARPLSTLAYERLFEKLWTKVAVVFGLSERQETSKRSPRTPLPPLLFVHGSYHSAWCYAEEFLPMFSKLGYTCYAVSLRGTAPTGMAATSKGAQTVRIEEHVSDLTEVLEYIKTASGSSSSEVRPVVIAHSFAGVVAMKLLESPQVRAGLGGVCFLCSVPPSGNGPMTLRFLQTNFLASLKIVYGFVLKAITFDPAVARELLFDESFADSDLARYLQRFKADSKVVLDLPSLARVLPSVTSTGPDGRATWLDEGGARPQLMVLGGENDFIVDQPGVVETARYCGVDAQFLPGGYHDLMLGNKAEPTAEKISDWLRLNVLAGVASNTPTPPPPQPPQLKNQVR